MNIKALKEYASDLLDLAIKKEKFRDYVIGRNVYSIKVKDEMGKESECVFAKMDAIYNYHIKNPAQEIDKKLYDILAECTPVSKSIERLILLLKIIEYQIVAEKEKRAPFNIDTETLLSNLRNNFNDNIDMYKSEAYEKLGFWNEIEQHNRSLLENYGHKIL